MPIFHHNAIDILSLACLTAIVPFAFRSPADAPLRHGADLIGLARWLVQAERYQEALRLFRRAVDMGLPDQLLFPALWEIAATEKRLGHADAGSGARSPNWPPRRTPTACARWRRWPNTTSTASATTPWRWR